MNDIKCNYIIDSCCDLPREVIDRPGVELLQFPYIQENVEHFDDLFTSTTPKEFYAPMRKGKFPSTAQIPLPIMEAAFRRAIESGVPTVYLGFSSGLSGNFGTAVMLHDQLLEEYPDAKFYVVDTLLASLPEGFLVVEALKQREDGLTAEEIVAWVEEIRYYVGVIFMLDGFDALAAGGRIPSGVALAGSKLDVKPLLTIDTEGKLSVIGFARGRKKAFKQMVEYYKKNVIDIGRKGWVFAGSADAPKDVNHIIDLLHKDDETLPVLTSTVGPVIGSHVGPEMVCIAFWTNDRRKEISISQRIARKVKGEA